MGYGNYKGGRGAITIKEPKAPATDAQLSKLNELLDERDVDEPQAAIIRTALEFGLLKGMASAYIGLLMAYDMAPSAEVLELRRQLAEAQAQLAV